MSGIQLDPVDLASEEITPISREPIDKVVAAEWESKSITELHSELVTLESRKVAMLEMNKPEIAKQIQRGIALLESIINRRENKNERIIS